MALKLYELCGADDRRFSPYCWRSRLAIAHKRLDADFIPLRYTDKEEIEFSGQDKVPVLVDGSAIVYDSWTIANYLEERYPYRPPLFEDDSDRALARFLNHWTDNQLHPLLMKLLAYDIYRCLDSADRAYFRKTREPRLGMSLEDAHAMREQHLPALTALLAPLRLTLSEQTFLCGDEPAYGDYIVMGTLQWARRVSELSLLAEDDPIYAWRERMFDLFEGFARYEGAPRLVDADDLR